MNRINTLELELEMANFFSPRRNIVVPNVWWGLGLNHECDLLVVTKFGWATEIELKISESDLKRDQLKLHKHESDKIKQIYFGVPNYLNHKNIPENAGIIVVDSEKKFGCQGRVKIIKQPKINKYARKLTHTEIEKLLVLGCMRIWKLKKDLLEKKELR